MARRFKTYDDVRRYLSSLINRLESGEIKPEVAGRCTYISNTLLKVIQALEQKNATTGMDIKLQNLSGLTDKELLTLEIIMRKVEGD